MGATANYQNLGLRIYITRDDFKNLIENGIWFCDLWYRGEFAGETAVFVSLSAPARELLQGWYNGERQVIDAAKRDQADKYRENKLTKERRQGAKKPRRVRNTPDHVREDDG